MPLSCIIVDDEPLAVKLLESFVKKMPDMKLLGSFTDSVEAINAIKVQKPNLLFLDIQMPDLNGLELAQMLPKPTKVIFTTAFKEYAFDTYEVGAIDFLLKPISYSKFIAAIEKAREWFGINSIKSYDVNQHNSMISETSPSTLFLKVDGEYCQVAIDKILYVCGFKDYVMFFLENEKKPLITYLRMKVVEDILSPQKFIRVHRSYIVALDKIQKVDRNDCIYIKDEIIHVTDAFRDNFQKYLDNHKIII